MWRSRRRSARENNNKTRGFGSRLSRRDELLTRNVFLASAHFVCAAQRRARLLRGGARGCHATSAVRRSHWSWPIGGGRLLLLDCHSLQLAAPNGRTTTSLRRTRTPRSGLVVLLSWPFPRFLLSELRLGPCPSELHRQNGVDSVSVRMEERQRWAMIRPIARTHNGSR
jgi:hypothetical protein